ncbi:hypothetical protein HYFRA_00012574 [Hymenoscyphus fraxineus]|uniref:Uncharacterized protein n=1 Tax=Hymenoscyphus fraxineus TaxID=746836 RepID=A0A9N9L3F0_9HELO|nr:hypothetical protein HYFRA_00012574 [Hymenoscyphus fraxineus]
MVRKIQGRDITSARASSQKNWFSPASLPPCRKLVFRQPFTHQIPSLSTMESRLSDGHQRAELRQHFQVPHQNQHPECHRNQRPSDISHHKKLVHNTSYGERTRVETRGKRYNSGEKVAFCWGRLAYRTSKERSRSLEP